MLIAVGLLWFPVGGFLRFRGSSARRITDGWSDQNHRPYRDDAKATFEKLAGVEAAGNRMFKPLWPVPLIAIAGGIVPYSYGSGDPTDNTGLSGAFSVGDALGSVGSAIGTAACNTVGALQVGVGATADFAEASVAEGVGEGLGLTGAGLLGAVGGAIAFTAGAGLAFGAAYFAYQAIQS